MTSTLAELIEQGNDPQEYVGMWCDNLASAAKDHRPVVLACVQGNLCWILHTDLYGEWSCFSQESLAPRFDLRRAWNPDGTPPGLSW